MFNALTKLWKPEIYQGRRGKRNYFEGWYFKFADAAARKLYAIIPGVSLEREDASHAFIQVLDGLTTESWFVSYHMDEFSYSTKELEITIGESRFSRKGMKLRVYSDGLKLSGSLSFGDMVPWPVTPFSPGAMGWYAFVPFMECYHGVISFDHTVEGSLEMNDEETSFAGGRGYIEKDWGTSFPRYYIWIQSNHFEQPGISLMVSIANIPWLGNSFDGFLIGFYFNKRLLRFTTYTGAKIRKLNLHENTVKIHVSDTNYRLEIEARRDTKSGILKAPRVGAMSHRIRESMTSVVSARLYMIRRDSEELIFSGTGRNAGLEMGGNVNELQQTNK